MTGPAPTTASPSIKTGNVWLGGNGAYQPGPAPGSADQFAPRPNAPAPAPFREGGGEIGIYHDSFILKFSPDGKFLGEIGKANGSKGSLDTDNVRGVATDPLPPGNQRARAGRRLWQQARLGLGRRDA